MGLVYMTIDPVRDSTDIYGDIQGKLIDMRFAYPYVCPDIWSISNGVDKMGFW